MYRRNGRGRLLLLIFVSLAILVITLDFRFADSGPLSPAKDFAVGVVAPLQRGLTTVFRPVGDFFASLGEIGRLRSENDRLKAELEAGAAEVRRAQAIQQEIEELTDLLGLDEPWTAMDKVAAQVFGFSPSNYRWARFIDKGRADGIRPDMAVVSADGLVGKVIRSTNSTSTILLLIDPKAAAGARVEGRRDTGKIQGIGEGSRLALELIDSNSDVAEGDFVATSGYDEGIYPPGIPIGLIHEIAGDVRRPDQTIVVEPFVDFTALDYVFVLLETGRQLATSAGGG